MASSYTPLLRLTLPTTGELQGTWGDTVNNGITSLTEAAIAGTAAIVMSDANHTLTVANGATDEARRMFVTLTGALTATRNVICPAVSKMYVVRNNTTGGQSIVFKTSAGTGITVANGQSALLYCDGTNVVEAFSAFSGSVTLPAGTANGVAYLNGSKVLTTGSALTFDGGGLTVTGATPSTTVFETSTGRNNRLILTQNGDLTTYNLTFSTFGAPAQVWQIGNAEQMRLTPTGLGIGTSSPQQRLDINSAADVRARLLVDGAAISQWQAVPGEARLHGIGTNVLGLWTNGTERMRIDSAGNFMVGVTSSTLAPGFASKVCIVYPGGVTKYGVALQPGVNNTNALSFIDAAGVSSVGSIFVSGTGTSYLTSSDYRLKDITGPVTGARDFILALKPKQGTWKSDGSKFVGFLAHEFQEVSPSSVSGEKDEVDDDGKPVCQAMQASSAEVMANIIALLQEQQATLDAQAAEIAALKGAA